jgi:hypothetical protein
VVDFLVEVHSVQGIRLYLPVSPPNIPMACSLFLLNYPTKLFRHLGYDWILSVTGIENDLFALEFIGQFGNGYDFGTVVSVDFELIF